MTFHLGHLMGAPVLNQPLSEVAQVLADARSKREADALKVWRESVKAVGVDKKLTAKQVEALAAAQFDLSRTPQQFDADVAKWRNYLAWQKRLGELPSPEDQSRQSAEWVEKSQALLEEIARLQKEQRELVRLHAVMPMHWTGVKSQYETAEQAATELLAD